MNITRLILVLLFAVLVQGCQPNYTCYDAENWGSPVITINSNPQSTYKKEGDFQLANWTKSGYYLNGKQIYFLVKTSYGYINAMEGGTSQAAYFTNIQNYENAEYNYGWSFMYGGYAGNTLNQIMATSGMCSFCDTDSNAEICANYSSGNQAACTKCGNVGVSENVCANNTCTTTLDDELPVTNAPCFLTNGLGAYVAFSAGPSTDPNATGGLVGKPLHLGMTDISSSNFYYAGQKTSGIVSSPPSECTDGQMCGVNFKMLDRYYTDNYGAVQVLMLSGVVSSNPGIITKIVAYIQSSLCWAKEEMFTNLTGESEFQGYIRAILVLYVIIYAISFLLGIVQVTQKDLMIRILKIAIIIQLISPSSWEFFGNNFFMFFTQGIGEITGMLFGGGQESVEVGAAGITQSAYSSVCPCNIMNVSGFEQFDIALKSLFAAPTQAKLKAMIFENMALGTVKYLVINGLFLYFIWIVIQSVFTYIMSYLGLTLIIILAPIFIPFMLFEFTKSFFTNWLKFLISYFIQPIIILTFTFFMFQIIMNNIYNLYGYSVCDEEMWSIKLGKIIDIEFYYWKAQLGDPGEKEIIHIPNNHFQCDNTTGCLGNIFQADCNCISCQPYECTGNRYVKYPYLNPDDPHDSGRLTDFENGELGIEALDLLLLCFMMWFMAKFNEIVPDIAQDIGGTPMQMASMSAAGTALRGGLVGTVGNIASIGNELIKAGTGVDIKSGLEKAGKALSERREMIGRTYYGASKKVKAVAKGAETLSINLLTGKPFVKAGAKLVYKVGTAPVSLAGYVASKGLKKAGANKLGASLASHTSFGSIEQDGGVGASASKGTKGFFKGLVGKGKSPREKGYFYGHATTFQDKIGGMIDVAYHAPKRAMRQKAHKYTLGMVGEDYRSTVKGREADDRFWARTAEQHRVNREGRLSGGKLYDSYVRKATGGRLHGDTGSSGDVVGGRRTPPTKARRR